MIRHFWSNPVLSVIIFDFFHFVVFDNTAFHRLCIVLIAFLTISVIFVPIFAFWITNWEGHLWVIGVVPFPKGIYGCGFMFWDSSTVVILNLRRCSSLMRNWMTKSIDKELGIPFGTDRHVDIYIDWAVSFTLRMRKTSKDMNTYEVICFIRFIRFIWFHLISFILSITNKETSVYPFEMDNYG